MDMFSRIVRLFILGTKIILYILGRIYLHLKYDDYSIAEKFRKQGAKIGENCSLQIRGLASEPYLVEIGDHVSITKDVNLITHDGGSSMLRDELPYLRYFGKIIIEDHCFIGNGAIITAGVRIGRNSIIGPMSVVINDVKPGSIMIGNPAIRVSTIEKYKEKCLQEWERQGLTKFEPMFKGMNKFEVQKIMVSKAFRKELKKHLLSVDFSKPPQT